MHLPLYIYNTLQRQKVLFEPINPPFVGLYVCGPTVYGDAHLGHARSALAFDIVYRYLQYRGYQVRYVRNITDVGHLEQDADVGQDKINKKAQQDRKIPMEVVQQYTNAYHHAMDLLHILPPHIEPQASGHIMEQMAMVQKLVDQGDAYVVNGSVYFDVVQYAKHHPYGCLSGRNIDDLIAGHRPLAHQDEKKHTLDFALWKKASPTHIMKWQSPWSLGFPGWHIECTAMAATYLGLPFDIHGGGLDLLFPHHECEIAQAQAAHQQPMARYWMHNNLVMIKQQKMGKSLNNFITLTELFSGQHRLLTQAYSPMTLRFFMLQAHYRSTIDFSNTGLQTAAKGYRKIMNGYHLLQDLLYVEDNAVDLNQHMIQQVEQQVLACHQAMADDFNTTKVMAALFGLLKIIHVLGLGELPVAALGQTTFQQLKTTYHIFVITLLGLKEERIPLAKDCMQALITLYEQAKKQKNYQQIDLLRKALHAQGICLQDGKKGVLYGYTT